MAMTAVAEEAGSYTNPTGLFDFQVEGVVQCYSTRQQLVVFDTGTGKTHLAMALSGLLFDEDEVDCVLMVCERNKLREHRDDFTKFTRLGAMVYHGSGRQQRLERWTAKHGRPPHVLISTYETLRTDCATAYRQPGKRGVSHKDGPLMPFLRERRMLVVYDEVAKLRNRKSSTYDGHMYMLRQLRKRDPDLRVVGLTATPISTGWENAFNQFRLVAPASMPTVTAFEGYFFQRDAGGRPQRDIYGRPVYRDDRMHQFAELCQPWMIRKRKTDPDVIDQFPALVEESKIVEMATDQAGLYQLVEDLGVDEEGEWDPPPGLWLTLRQVAAHPASLTRSQGELATLLTQELGVQYLRSISSAKTSALLAYLEPLVLGQGDKAVVFSFFGQSVLPILASALREAKVKCYTYHGQMTGPERERARVDFRADPEPCVFLTSDAGARGINLPEASYVVEYESALTHDMREQRVNRCSRIDGGKKLLTCQTMVLDQTVEAAIIQKMLARNDQQDVIRGDLDAGGDFVSAALRRELLQISRMSRRKRGS